ncbi:MAG TPA: nitrile hydratase accessory protein [Paraburkholderia sp.]|nr:nitrile hydratase accessory protein [Paraburkholderia sp.]
MKPEDVLACESLAEFREIEALSFPTPWSARAFGIVLAAAERKLFSLTDFQRQLIKDIAVYERHAGPIDSDEAYYSCWIVALSGLLEAKGLLGKPRLLAAEEVIRAAPAANAHDHDHDHGHGIDHGGTRFSPAPIYREYGQ